MSHPLARLSAWSMRSPVPWVGLGSMAMLAAAWIAVHPTALSAAQARTPATPPAATLVPVTVHEGTSMSVSASPDGRTLAIDLQGSIWTVPASGGAGTRLTDLFNDARQPAWSPDGQWIAFFAYRDGGYDLWAVAPDGKGQHQLTWGSFDDREPAWSHDGSRLAFSSDRGNPLGSDYNIWILEVASGQLTQVTAPPAYTGATAQTVQYAYDTNGNLTSVTDPASAVTNYTYDANGNVATITDPNSNVVTRSYDAKNALILETRTASTASSSATSVYTRYVYDSEDHLRFTISAEGRVTEYRYDTAGNLQVTIDYPDSAFAIGSTAQTEAQMNTWVSGLTDRSNTEICKYVYDARGDLSQSTHYGAASTAGVEATTEGYNQTVFVYDQAGRLLSRTQGPQAPGCCRDG